jgi:transposase-like protein
LAFAETWSTRYPAIVRLRRSHRAEFVPFLAFPLAVRRVIYTTNLIGRSTPVCGRSPATSASSRTSRPR